MIDVRTSAKVSAVPWIEQRPLSPEAFERVRTRSIFECFKWEQQVVDSLVMSPFPIVLKKSAWEEISKSAEILAGETLAAELELLDKPQLHSELGLGKPVLKTLKRASREEPSPLSTRVIRFDFHWTNDGWRVSEANTDVPSGFVEASGVTALMAPYYPEYTTAGDPAGALAESASKNMATSPTAVFLHATAYSEDRQVMEYLASRFRERGFKTVVASPTHLRWEEGRARLVEEWGGTPVDFIHRFFPSELLPHLPNKCGWTRYYNGSTTPTCNPATTILSQSKRLPVVWDRLKSPTTEWRRLLPTTVCPSELGGKFTDDWVLKPALGRVGEDVAVAGEIRGDRYRKIVEQVRKKPKWWVAQKRFEAISMNVGGKDCYPCVGVYTVDGKSVGAYGRTSSRKITDKYSQDAAVFVAGE